MNKTAIFLTVLACAGVLGARAADESREQAQTDRLARELAIFNSIAKELNTNFVDTINSQKMIGDAVEYFLYQLDPYTQYFPANDQEELEQLSANGYAGIGSAINLRGDTVYVARPYWDSPARRAGLRAGDAIIAVDGVSAIKPADVGDVSKRLRGQAGTVVGVDYIRPYSDSAVRHIDIVRDRIPTIALPYAGLIGDDIGYINLATFSESAGRDFKAALRRLNSESRLKGLILDMRNNGGGIVDGAIEIAGTVLPRGTEVVRTRGRATGEKVYKTTENPIAGDLPLVILVNGGTASASEIVTGSMQDLDRAVIIGERTYGKGLVQTTVPLLFNSLLKLTVSKYYLPSGRLIQALDYANRNEDGSPKHTPDSLANEYRTAAGRTVRDGGGISPDIVVKEKEINRLQYNLVSDFWIFDYVTRYLSEHPEYTTAVATEAMFEEFKGTIDPSRFNYDKPAERIIEVLRTTARNEGYMTDSLATQIDVLEGMLHHDLDRDLDNNRTEIMELIENELRQRLLSESEQVKRSLDSDSTVLRAVEILNNPSEYRRLLSTPRN